MSRICHCLEVARNSCFSTKFEVHLHQCFELSRKFERENFTYRNWLSGISNETKVQKIQKEILQRSESASLVDASIIY